jgi:uncharacterized RDD family membrane protein YckC
MDKDIEFRPLTPGLGFHPFSDGLPYAPLKKKNGSSGPSMGTGAVAAGPATFAKTLPTLAPRKIATPRVSVPVATPTQQQQSAPMPSTSFNSAASAVKPFAEPAYGYVYLAKRSLAYIIDSSLNTALSATGLSLVLVNQNIQPEALMNPGIVVLSTLFFVLFNWALITAQEIAFGSSVGKRIFGLAVRGSTSAIFLRAFFFLPSAGFCALGLLWSVFDKRKRCWHDVVVGVQPIELARL